MPLTLAFFLVMGSHTQQLRRLGPQISGLENKKNRKTKEITEIQQIILALHIVKKERRKPNRQVNIVKLSRKGVRECQEEMEHERVPTAPKKEEEERKFAR